MDVHIKTEEAWASAISHNSSNVPKPAHSPLLLLTFCVATAHLLTPNTASLSCQIYGPWPWLQEPPIRILILREEEQTVCICRICGIMSTTVGFLLMGALGLPAVSLGAAVRMNMRELSLNLSNAFSVRIVRRVIARGKAWIDTRSCTRGKTCSIVNFAIRNSAAKTHFGTTSALTQAKSL